MAAAAAFDRCGYAAASIDQIAEEGGVTKGALYFHFKSKADLAIAVMHGQYERWERARLAIEARRLPALIQLDALVSESAKLLGNDPLVKAGMRLSQDINLLPPESVRPLERLIAQVRPLIERARTDGAILPHTDSTAAARALVGGMLGVQDVSERLRQHTDMGGHIEEWWSQFMRPALTGQWPGEPR